MNNRTRFMYLVFGNRRVGCLAMQVNRVAGTVSYGVSVVHDVDSFDREVAQSLANKRLDNQPTMVSLPPGATGHDISMAVMKNVSRNSAAPTKARRAAVRWLRRPTVVKNGFDACGVWSNV